MRIEVWHQDWTRAKGPVRAGEGPAGSKREIAEHFQEGRYTKVDEIEIAGDEWHAAADAAWRRPSTACRAGDVLIAHKGGIARRTAFVLMRGEDGMRLQKLDLEKTDSMTARMAPSPAPHAPALPAFITASRPRRRAGAFA